MRINYVSHQTTPWEASSRVFQIIFFYFFSSQFIILMNKTSRLNGMDTGYFIRFVMGILVSSNVKRKHKSPGRRKKNKF